MFHHSRQTLKHTIALKLRRLKYGKPKQKVFCVGFQKTGSLYIPMAQQICAQECVLFAETEMYYADDDHLSTAGAKLKVLPLLEQGLSGILNDPG